MLLVHIAHSKNLKFTMKITPSKVQPKASFTHASLADLRCSAFSITENRMVSLAKDCSDSKQNQMIH